jgi:TIR domain
MTTRIFINYRRDDTTSTAGRLHDRLAESFGRENLFMDVDHIPAGVDFIDHLKTQVAACNDFLAIIGPNWLDARNENGERRLDAPDDFVSVEIAAALSRNIRVIPVLVDGARMPKENELPDLLKPLVRRQAIELRNAHFGRDAEAVIEKIRGTTAGLGYGWRVPAMGAMAATLVVSGLLYWTGVPISLPWAMRSEIRAEQEGKAKAAAEAEWKSRADAERRADLAEQERKADVRLAGILAEVERKAKLLLSEQQERNATAAAASEERARAERIERERLAALNAEAMAKAERAERERLAARNAEAMAKAERAESERRTARKAEERARAERAERERREAMAATERAERERRTARKAEERARAERPEGDSRTARNAQSMARVENPERKRLLAPTAIADHEGDGLLTGLAIALTP